MATTKTAKKEKLIPPDLKRCQAERRMGSFMTLGPREIVRCSNRAVWIAKENKLNEDGCIGSMSLCDECAHVMVNNFGAAYATLKPVRPGGAGHG